MSHPSASDEPIGSGVEAHPELRYPQVVRTIADTPWAILPETLAAILDVVTLRAHGRMINDEEIQARIGSGPARRPSYQVGAVAVLPLYGVLFPRANLMTEMSGGTSLQQFAAAFDQAISDPQVERVVIDVNSPGGSVALVTETAAKIRAARGSKPITAISNTIAASAAYWLAAQADEIVVTPSGSVGSIGVLAAHDDISAAQEKVGVNTTLISAGKFKTEGNPFEPLSDEARAAIQATVDEFYGMFLGDVAKGRGATVRAVRGGFGEGRMVSARQAVEMGMADRVDTFDSALTRRPSLAAAQTRAEASLADPLADEEDSAEGPAAESLEPLRTLAADIRKGNDASAAARVLNAIAKDMQPRKEALA